MKKIILFILIIAISIPVFSADTERTRSELETLFADNVAGEIGAQDLRDFLKSLFIINDDDTLFWNDSTYINSINVEKLQNWNSKTTFISQNDIDSDTTFTDALEATYHIYSIVIDNLSGIESQDIKVEADTTEIWSGTIGWAETRRLLFSDFTSRAIFEKSSDQDISITNNGGIWFDGVDITITTKRIFED